MKPWMKKLLIAFGILVIVLWIGSDPTGSAHTVRALISDIVGAAQGVIKFLKALTSGS